jgi:FlaA1/EpsC-like NDP-sugar epimerase
MDLYDWISMVALLVSYVAVIGFIIVNHWRIDWRHNNWGRHVMRFSYTYVAIISVALAGRIFGDYPGRRAVITLLYVVLAGVMVERLWMVLRPSRRLAERDLRERDKTG